MLFKNYFDVIGMILLSIDVVMVPFGLAWEDVGARFSDVVSLISVGYWSLDMILSFFMPYERGSVTISDCRVTSLHYVQRSFILDRLILSIEWISMVLSHTGETINAPPSLFKIVRFLKIMRLVRAFTRMNGDRYKESMDALRRQAVVHGLEALFSFVTGTGRYFMLFMWTSHVRPCVWYYLVRTEDPTIELAWSFEQRANAGELVVGGNPARLGWWYLSGIYFTVVSLASFRRR